MKPSEEAEPDPAPVRGGRRFKRPVKVSAAIAAGMGMFFAAGLFGAGWYFANEALKVTHDPPDYPFRVGQVSEAEVELPARGDTLRPGVWGLEWDGGWAVLGKVLRQDADTAVRSVEQLHGSLEPGVQARITAWTYGGDPKQAHGLEYSEVDVPGPLGDMPAWLVAGESDTWVVAVHGRNANPAETLRAVPAMHAAGLPVLAVTHRNDEGAPPSPDGMHHFGDSEWEDVAAAVDFARERGAREVVLAGWSMGGTVVMTALRRMERPDLVSGVILDSPALDWSSLLDKQAAARGLPPALTVTAKHLVELRAGIDLDDLDLRDYAPDLEVPLLLFADLADETVDVDATLEFAELAPEGLVRMVATEAGHTASWNEDPQRYESELEEFLRSEV